MPRPPGLGLGTSLVALLTLVPVVFVSVVGASVAGSGPALRFGSLGPGRESCHLPLRLILLGER